VSTSGKYGSAEGEEEGVEDLEQVGDAFVEVAENTEVIDLQDAEELADTVRELEITELSNVSAYIYKLPI